MTQIFISTINGVPYRPTASMILSYHSREDLIVCVTQEVVRDTTHQTKTIAFDGKDFVFPFDFYGVDTIFFSNKYPGIYKDKGIYSAEFIDSGVTFSFNASVLLRGVATPVPVY